MGVPVEIVPGTVVAAGGARVGVPGEVLHVAERDTGVQVGAERIVELRAGLDCEPDEIDELFGTAA